MMSDTISKVRCNYVTSRLQLKSSGEYLENPENRAIQILGYAHVVLRGQIGAVKIKSLQQLVDQIEGEV